MQTSDDCSVDVYKDNYFTRGGGQSVWTCGTYIIMMQAISPTSRFPTSTPKKTTHNWRVITT